MENDNTVQLGQRMLDHLSMQLLINEQDAEHRWKVIRDIVKDGPSEAAARDASSMLRQYLDKIADIDSLKRQQTLVTHLHAQAKKDEQKTKEEVK